ncbi:hypothetical protein [Caulobacter sp. D5]|uniref:hypothetical protein n=1 Tax=Caulobacter sp. D5 TaxID=357400 RepID=UPI0011B4D71C|nr:hypothetical protein [Caulobacter sp. D5]
MGRREGCFAAQARGAYLAVSVYVAAVVVGLSMVGAWRPSNLKTTLVWWATVALGSGFSAMKLAAQPGTARRLIAEAIAWTEIVVFLSEVHTLPLWGELLLLPAMTLVAMMLAVAPRAPNTAIIVKPLSGLQVYVGLAIILFSLVGVFKEPEDFLTWNTLREFLDPILLSLALIPFLFVLAMLMETESNFTSLRILGGDPALARYAERRALLAFGVDFDGARRLARDIRGRDIADRAGVRAAIAEIKRQKQRERHPPVVAAQDGWSPVAACAALAGLGVKAGDYHRTPGEWWAQAPSVKVAEGLFEPRVSYYVAGVEDAATRLRLHLQADLLAPGGEGDQAYARLAECLLGWALGEAAVQAVSPHLISGAARTFRFELAEVSLEHHAWGKAKQSGYSRGVVIRHRAHVEPVYG